MAGLTLYSELAKIFGQIIRGRNNYIIVTKTQHTHIYNTLLTKLCTQPHKKIGCKVGFELIVSCQNLNWEIEKNSFDIFQPCHFSTMSFGNGWGCLFLAMHGWLKSDSPIFHLKKPCWFPASPKIIIVQKSIHKLCCIFLFSNF